MRSILGTLFAAAALACCMVAQAADTSTPAKTAAPGLSVAASPTAPRERIEAPPMGTAAARANYKSMLERAAKDYSTDRARCRTLSGNARSVCVTEAKVRSKNAEMDAEATYRNTARARLDAKTVAANGAYAVAKAKCNAYAGAERRTCIKEAKGKQSQAIAAAMHSRG